MCEKENDEGGGDALSYGPISLKQGMDHSLDIRTTIYPLALLKASQAFREIKSGETIEILLSDPDTREYLFKVLPASLCELIEIREGKSFCRILVRKRA